MSSAERPYGLAELARAIDARWSRRAQIADRPLFFQGLLGFAAVLSPGGMVAGVQTNNPGQLGRTRALGESPASGFVGTPGGLRSIERFASLEHGVAAWQAAVMEQPELVWGLASGDAGELASAMLTCRVFGPEGHEAPGAEELTAQLGAALKEAAAGVQAYVGGTCEDRWSARASALPVLSGVSGGGESAGGEQAAPGAQDMSATRKVVVTAGAAMGATALARLATGRSLPQSAAIGVGALGGWELLWWARRRHQRAKLFAVARGEADRLGRQLVVVGSPDRGATSGYGCGDLTIDIGPSSCPNALVADIGKRLPLEDDSVVVFVACVLEYVEDYEASLAELRRVSGGHLYVVRVEPWTLTAYLYPGARRTVGPGALRTSGLAAERRAFLVRGG
jgi:hypothetical protein